MPLDLSITANKVRTFQNSQVCGSFILLRVNTSGECLNMSKFQLTTEGQIFAFLTYFEKLLHRSQSFAQRKSVDHPSTIQPPEA